MFSSIKSKEYYSLFLTPGMMQTLREAISDYEVNRWGLSEEQRLEVGEIKRRLRNIIVGDKRKRMKAGGKDV